MTYISALVHKEHYWIHTIYFKVFGGFASYPQPFHACGSTPKFDRTIWRNPST